MRVMVTGGTGFAGSHTVRGFLAAGHSVRLLVRNAEKVRRVFDPFDIAFPDGDIIVGDIIDEASVLRAMEGCDAVFHGAALVDMRRSMAKKVLETNRRGVELVVGGAHRRGLPSIVYVSSMSVFFTPGCSPLHHEMPIATGTTAYGQSKAQGEHEVRRMQSEGAAIRISYPTGIIGPDDPGLSDANQAKQIPGVLFQPFHLNDSIEPLRYRPRAIRIDLAGVLPHRLIQPPQNVLVHRHFRFPLFSQLLLA